MKRHTAIPCSPAGGLYGPEALTPLLALAPSRTLGNAPVDHAKTQGAFGHIVGRLDVGASDKGEIGPTIGAETLGQGRRRAPAWVRRAFWRKSSRICFRRRWKVAGVS